MARTLNDEGAIGRFQDRDVVIQSQIVLRPTGENDRLARQDLQMLEVIFQDRLDLYYYAKDLQSRWISCNAACAFLLNRARSEDVIGLNEADFFPPAIATAIRRDDLKVLETGVALKNRMEMIVDAYGSPTWAQTHKYPIVDPHGRSLGLVGTTILHSDASNLPPNLSFFRHVIDYIHTHLSEPIRVGDLADMLNLSESQFRRKFRTQFTMSPQEFILNLRLQSAARALSRADDSISYISHACGFSDQSHFTRQFKRFLGETPRTFRMRRSIIPRAPALS